MQCPKCKKLLTEKTTNLCLSCGARFDEETEEKIRLYFDIKDDMVTMQGINSSGQNMINKINAKLASLGNLFNRELRAEKAEIKEPEPVKPAPATAPVQVLKTAPKPVPALAVKKEKKKSDGQFELAVGQKWFLIIGIITMVFGIGYFLKYSFDQGWVSPFWRVISVYAWGVGMLYGGNQFRKKGYHVFGLNIIGGGIATLYFGAFAAFHLFGLVGQAPSFIIMAAITVISGVLALRYNAVGLACLGIFGGFLTPLLLSTGSMDHIFLFTYMVILNLGIMWISFYRKWGGLQVLGFIATYLLYSGWFIGDYKKELFWPSIIYLNIFYLIYAVTPLLYSIFRKKQEKVGGLGIIFPNSFIAFCFSWTMVADKYFTEMVSVITIFYAFVFLSLAAYLHKKGLKEQNAFAVFIGKAALFLFLTVPFYFSGHWVTLFWLVLAVVLYWMSEKIDRKSFEAWSYIMIIFVVLKFFFYDYSEIFRLSLHSIEFRSGYTNLLTERYITSGILLGTLGWFIWKAKRGMVSFLSIIFGLSLFMILNVEVMAFFNAYNSTATFAAVSILWGLYSVSLMILGLWKDKKYLRQTAIALFVFTLIKVFIFDMSRISTPARIISFIVTGLLLIGTSFLYYRFKGKVIETLGGEKNEER